jgi:hypothetical protein
LQSAVRGEKNQEPRYQLYKKSENDFFPFVAAGSFQLPAGMQLALLIGFPKWATGKKLFEQQMGKDKYDKDSARVQAPAQQVTHHVTTNYLNKDFILVLRDPQGTVFRVRF